MLIPKPAKVLIAVLSAIAFVSACSSSTSPETAAEMACTIANLTVNSSKVLPPMTQCETQELEQTGDHGFILQFEGQGKFASDKGIDIDKNFIFYQPLKELTPVWDAALSSGDISKFYVNFKDGCNSVWEMSRAQVQDLIDKKVDPQTFTKNMNITGWAYC